MDYTEIKFSPEELNRYNRQIIYQDWGVEGQQKVRQATVFIAGAGGLGAPVSIYLAVAGVGRLRICDNGTVERSNLNRQILYTDEDLHQLKVVSAQKNLKKLNPHLEIDCFSETISRDTIDRLAGNADIIVDCLDNFETRYILNEYAVRKKLPLVHAGIEGLTGQLTFIHPPHTPCLRCIIPEAPTSKIFPVIGVTPGIIGCLEGNEVLKYLIGIGSNLKGFLLIWNGNDTDFYRIEVAKDPNCLVCGQRANAV
ncbi:MAG: HesA/MoeB/ThiF family protein [Thermodesulfobacteriota bacterium]|nr:MAG: HesA/MoeB/ThiF family protein [Thermodesulfobacteriota bacterium]